MATWPADGTENWNQAMKAFVDVSHAADGKILTLAEKASAMSGAEDDRVVADKGYVDTTVENSVTELSSGGLTGALSGSTASFSKLIQFQNGYKTLMGYQKRVAGSGTIETIDISSASFTGIFYANVISFDTATSQDNSVELSAVSPTSLTAKNPLGVVRNEGFFYKVEGY
jgi:hypothetical protein